MKKQQVNVHLRLYYIFNIYHVVYYYLLYKSDFTGIGIGIYREYVRVLLSEGDSSYLLDDLNRFTYYRYYMGSLNKGVSITILTIIPLATSFRIAAFIWFGFRKSKISLYTVTYIL